MTPSSPGSVLFSPLPEWKKPWSEVVLSYGAQAIMIAILVWIRLLNPEILEPPKKDYHAIELVPTPIPVNLEPQRQLPRPVVTAKLDPGYHIYKYSKTPAKGGPVNTSFDFFDPADLKVEGDWTPSTEPEKHKDPNFPEVDSVSYHEDEVTGSIKLKIPENAAPGKRVLHCQAGYMVCDAKHCSFPGRWTLPETVLTVLPGDGKGPKTAVIAPDTQWFTPAVHTCTMDSGEPHAPPPPGSPSSIIPLQLSSTPLQISDWFG